VQGKVLLATAHPGVTAVLEAPFEGELSFRQREYFEPLYIPSERAIHLKPCDPSPETGIRI
jgi:hypothetical protein